MRTLSQAISEQPETQQPLAEPAWHRPRGLKLAFAVASFGALALSAYFLARSGPNTELSHTAAQPGEAQLTALVDDSVVRFPNPFDPSEVFEFPEGTTEADARAAVAEILMDRARERQASTAVPLRSNARSIARN